ncbi:MAG: GNAT family N-acetyltransferase [Caldilineaceae bacterium]
MPRRRASADVIGQWPSTIWVAEMDGAPVGFVWLQGDYAPVLRRSHGGRNPLWRPWIAHQRTRPMRAGRLLLGGVLPAWRGQGIGRQLWHHAGDEPLSPGGRRSPSGQSTWISGRAFLTAQGATPQQRYSLFAGEF